MAIPIVLLSFIRKRRDVPFRHLFWLFGAFIVLCGFTHFLEFYTFFSPIYRFSGLVKFLTALASWGTVLALIPTTPKALAMRSPEELEREIAVRTAELRNRAKEIEELNHKLRRAMAETHHRVKNNLQIVSALIDLQVMSEDPAIPKSELTRIAQHIRSLASIHELLTKQARNDEEVEYISANQTLQRIVAVVQQTLNGREIHIHADDFSVPVKYGTAMSVLVNELVSNGVKHGAGDITVELTLDGDPDDKQNRKRARLSVCDCGPGFPEGFDVATAANTGLDLVESLATWDLGGSTRYINKEDGGACVEVQFPFDEQENDVRA